jgi:lysophospholipase L1-like esterase
VKQHSCKCFIVMSAFLVMAASFAGANSSAQSQAPASQGQPTPAADCSQLPVMTQRLEADQKRLQDWPAMARYRDANSQLAPPAKSEARVIFMGDSITDFWTDPEYGGFFPGKSYVDRGVSGQTTPQMLVRFRPDVIALQPKVVVILAGTNDISGNTGPMPLSATEDNLATMAEIARVHDIHVVLASLTPVSDYGHGRDGAPINQTTRRPPEKILGLNVWIKQYAASNGHTYLDYFSAMVDDQGFLKKELSVDGLHPNGPGYAVMAPLAEQAIRAALKKKY